MNRKLYKLHEAYKKHNHSGAAYRINYPRTDDVSMVTSCTCGGAWMFLDDNKVFSRFDSGKARKEYLRHIYAALPTNAAADLRASLLSNPDSARLWQAAMAVRVGDLQQYLCEVDFNEYITKKLTAKELQDVETKYGVISST